MKKNKITKMIPVFRSDVEEHDFWEKVNSNDYFAGTGKIKLAMPLRTKSISLRLPQRLIDRLKKIAELKDVPYQSLIKILLDDKVSEEIKSLRA